MEKLLFILLLPLFGYSQEVTIANKVNNQWVFTSQSLKAANDVLDSAGITWFDFDSLTYQNDTVVNLIGHDTANTRVADRMIVNNIGTKLQTAVDYISGCNQICKALSCSRCLKTASCGCSCGGSGDGCFEVNNGLSVSISNLVRARLIQQ